MLRNLLAGLAILKPGPNIITDERGVVATYNEYLSSLDKAWLEANGWNFDFEEHQWCYLPNINTGAKQAEFAQRTAALIVDFKSLNLEW